MSDALLATGAAVLLAAVVLGSLCALTLGPLVVTLGLAERRRLGGARWGLASAACSALGLGVAAVGLQQALGPVPVLLGLAATWAAPLAVVALGASGGPVTGVRGRHE